MAQLYIKYSLPEDNRWPSARRGQQVTVCAQNAECRQTQIPIQDDSIKAKGWLYCCLDCPPKVIAPLIWLDQSGNHLYIRKALRGHCCILSTVLGSLVTCKCFANHTVYHHANHTVYHHGNHTVYNGRHLHLFLERLLQPISCYNVALYGFSFKTKPYRYEHSHNNQLK